jgi:glycosyltransferase involved in cell wall biosynthesis
MHTVATYDPEASLWSAALWLKALNRIARSRVSRFERWSLTHFHLSERGSFVREGSLLYFASLLGFPTAATLHGADFIQFAGAHPRVVRRILSRADAVISLGPVMAAFLSEDLGIPSLVVVIPNPIEIPEAATTLPLSERVLFAGEIGTRKGVDVLLAAWPIIRQARPAAQLVIAGPAGDVEPRPVEGVKWVGPQARIDVFGLIEDSSVVVLPSRAEVLPMFVLESMARGRPVVATAVGEVAYAVGEEHAVTSGDADAFAREVIALLADPQQATERGRALRERAIAIFGTTVVAEQMEQLYARIGSRPTPR